MNRTPAQHDLARSILAKVRPQVTETQRAVARAAAIIENAIERSDRMGERVVMLARDEANELSECVGKLRQVTEPST